MLFMRAIANKIILRNLRFHAFHGVMPQEGVVGQTFIVDMEMDVDYTSAMQSDDLIDTVSYSDVYDVVKAEMCQPSKLIEHLTMRIAKRVFSQFSKVERIKIRVVKQNPPMGADCDGAGVEMDFIRD